MAIFALVCAVIFGYIAFDMWWWAMFGWELMAVAATLEAIFAVWGLLR